MLRQESFESPKYSRHHRGTGAPDRRSDLPIWYLEFLQLSRPSGIGIVDQIKEAVLGNQSPSEFGSSIEVHLDDGGGDEYDKD